MCQHRLLFGWRHYTRERELCTVEQIKGHSISSLQDLLLDYRSCLTPFYYFLFFFQTKIRQSNENHRSFLAQEVSINFCVSNSIKVIDRYLCPSRVQSFFFCQAKSIDIYRWNRNRDTDLLQENAFIFGWCKGRIVPRNKNLSHEWLTISCHLSNHRSVSWYRSPIEHLKCTIKLVSQLLQLLQVASPTWSEHSLAISWNMASLSTWVSSSTKHIPVA